MSEVPLPRPSRADTRTSALRAVAVGASLALIVLCTGWELVWARTGHGTLVLKALPFALALPGLARHRLRTYRWVCLLVWLYVAEGAVRITDRAPVPRLAALEIALSLLLFAACAAQVRWRLARGRQAAAPAG